MKNNYAWAIIAVVLVVALGAIWYMTKKVSDVPVTEVATSTPATGSAQTTTKGTPARGTTSVTTTTTTTTTDTRPKITSITPSSGKANTVAMIKGANFDAKTNVVTFGPSKGLHHQDGTPDNQIESLPSSDGKTLTFSVPVSAPSGSLCDQNNVCKVYGTDNTKAGTYMVTVVNQNGLSNEMPFTVIAN
jgi:hypothetical protein